MEPLLYAFIDGICTSVGAPRPERIEVDNQVNAAASSSGGAVLVLGARTGADYRLRAGRRGSTSSSSPGSVAHELGHISQGSGARLMVLVSSINAWFARVVYERDTWDQTLESWSSPENGQLMILGGLVRLVVCSPGACSGSSSTSGTSSTWSSSASVNSTPIATKRGWSSAKVFAQSSWRLRELHLASGFAMSDLQSSWQQPPAAGQLPETDPDERPPDSQGDARRLSEIRGRGQDGPVRLPPFGSPIDARAKLEEPGEGIFNLDGPATDVFRNFDSLARCVTFEYYKSLLGREISKDQLYPVAELVESQTVAQEGHVAFDRFFLKAMPFTQQLGLPYDYPKAPPNARAAQAL